MIRLLPISTSDVELYSFVEELLVTSFPPEEYRPLAQFREYTDRMENFHINIIAKSNRPVGFITYWSFNGFYYVEHFAIAPTLRNGGYGKHTLECLCSTLSLPIVLEVERPTKETEYLIKEAERPTEDVVVRRIRFYRHHGFVLWEKDYHQPPYKPGDGYLPMYLMVYGNLDAEKDYEKIKQQIHTAVYSEF